MFIFQAAELLAVTLLSPGNLPENLRTSKPVRKSSSSLDMISFWGTLLSVISQQQLKANNYNLLVTPVTFFSLVLNGSPLTLNANFTKKKIYFSEFVFFWISCFFFLKQELCFFPACCLQTSFLKKEHDWHAEEEAKFKPSSEESRQYRSQPYSAHHFPKAPLTLFPGLQGDLDLPMELST